MREKFSDYVNWNIMTGGGDVRRKIRINNFAKYFQGTEETKEWEDNCR